MDDDEWLERIWEHREEVLYPSLFGMNSEGIFTIPSDRLHAGKLTDWRFTTCGVFKFSPTPERQSWLYVSSGLSNAWYETVPNPDGPSGFGCEFTFETTEDADWPIQRLHQIMVYQIGLCCGLYPDGKPIGDFDRVPLGSPIDWRTSALTRMMLAKPVGYQDVHQLESGRLEMTALVGISENEAAYARTHGGDRLLKRLSAAGAFPVTDPSRSEIEI